MKNDDILEIQVSIEITLHPPRPNSVDSGSVNTLRVKQPRDLLFLEDPLLEQAKKVIVESQQGSVSILQRQLRIGYSRAASLIGKLEELGVVGPFRGSKARDVLSKSID